MVNGDYQIEVSAVGMFSQIVNENVTCDSEECEMCTPLVVLYLQEQPTTEATSTTTTTTTSTTTKTTTTTTTTPFCLTKPKKMILITILDKETAEPLAGASVNISTSELSASHQSTIAGLVEDFTLESGVFSVSVAHAGYIAKQEDVTVDCVSIECENCENSFSINLEKISSINITDPVDPANNNTVIPEVCEGATGSITVLEYVTGQPVSGAAVNVILLSNSEDVTETHEIVNKKLSNADGKIEIPMTLNGNYKISVTKE